MKHPPTDRAPFDTTLFLSQIWQDFHELSNAEGDDYVRVRRSMFSRIAAIPDVLANLRSGGPEPGRPSLELHCIFCNAEVTRCHCTEFHSVAPDE